ncbi:MAG: PH domain-containing protein [Planctomycetes bacterium]|nr:PH domain-containing protein [Planctomycetota bacterium]
MNDQPTRPDDNEPQRDAAAELESAAHPPASQLDPAAEEELWEGRPSWRSAYPTLALWLIVTLIATIALGVLIRKSAVTLSTLGVCGALLVVVAGRAAWGVWHLSYRITTQRLFVRRGILSRTVDQTELLRVDDVRTRQSLVERILGIGQVEVLSSDRSDDELVLRSIENPEAVAEHIRRHTRSLQRRTLFMEQL